MDPFFTPIGVVFVEAVFALLSVLLKYVLDRRASGRRAPKPLAGPIATRTRDWALMCAVFFTGGLVAALIVWLVPPLGAPLPSVAFEYPANRARVTRKLPVNGTARNIPSDEQLWLVVEDAEGQYHPQIKSVGVDLSNNWVTYVDIGTDAPSDVGRSFIVIAVLANAAAADKFDTYQKTAAARRYPGMPNLPPTARRAAHVVVTRE
jgi:hypothetical protein